MPSVATKIIESDDDAAEIVQTPWKHLSKKHPGIVAIVSIAVLAVALRLWSMSVRSIESLVFDRLVLIVFVSVLWLLAISLAQFVILWKAIHKLMDRLMVLPMCDAYSRVPQKARDFVGRFFDSARERSAQHFLAWQQLKYAYHQHPVLLHEQSQLHERIGRPDPDIALLESASQEFLPVLLEQWKVRGVEEGYSVRLSRKVDNEAQKENEKETPDNPPSTPDWVRSVEDFMAIEILRYLAHYFVHLRTFGIFLVVTPLLLLLAIASYPFQPFRLYMLALATIIAGVVIALVYVFVDMDKDELLSRLSGTLPHRFQLSWSYMSHCIIYIVPLLAVLAAQFVGVSDLIRAWIDPVVHAVR
jgi:hypothetical protein